LSITADDVKRAAGILPAAVGCSTDDELDLLAVAEVSNARTVCESILGRQIDAESRFRGIIDAVILKLAGAALRQTAAARARVSVSVGEDDTGGGFFAYPDSVLESVRKDLSSIPGPSPAFFVPRLDEAETDDSES
jgi:hypothetical protein